VKEDDTVKEREKKKCPKRIKEVRE